MHSPEYFHHFLLTALFLIFSSTTAHANVTEQEAIQAQLASALASADYATKKCPNLLIDHARINALVDRSGKTLTELKASEDYTEQRDVILGMEKGKQAGLICFALPRAHGGYGRGIITEK